MNFNEYQIEAAKTAVFTNEFYPWASVVIEAAELSDLACKPILRGDNKTIDRSEVISEAGDVLWNLAAILSSQNITLEEVAEYNVEKLRSRLERNLIKGDGGDR